MSEQDEWQAQRAAVAADKERLRVSLAEWNLDGPREINGGVGLLPMSYTYAICLTCGATVMLNDLEELVEGMWTERGVRLHTGWHATTPPPNLSTTEGES